MFYQSVIHGLGFSSLFVNQKRVLRNSVDIRCFTWPITLGFPIHKRVQLKKQGKFLFLLKIDSYHMKTISFWKMSLRMKIIFLKRLVGNVLIEKSFYHCQVSFAWKLQVKIIQGCGCNLCDKFILCSLFIFTRTRNWCLLLLLYRTKCPPL